MVRMDKVYQGDIPKYRAALEKLRDEFRALDTATDWVRLRIDPLIEHADCLERFVKSARFARERSRLPRGVAMFRSALAYLRTNHVSCELRLGKMFNNCASR